MDTTTKTKEEIIQQAIDRFWETIPPTWHHIRANIRGIVTENFDLTVEQFHVLRHVRKGIRSLSELAEEKQISRPAISQAVDLLVEKGLITRQQSSEDRRIVLLELTENGNALLDKMFQINRKWMEERLTLLDQSEMETLLRAMDLLKQTFSPSS